MEAINKEHKGRIEVTLTADIEGFGVGNEQLSEFIHQSEYSFFDAIIRNIHDHLDYDFGEAGAKSIFWQMDDAKFMKKPGGDFALKYTIVEAEPRVKLKKTKVYEARRKMFHGKIRELLSEEIWDPEGLWPNDVRAIGRRVVNSLMGAHGPFKTITQYEVEMEKAAPELLPVCHEQALTIVNEMDFRDLELTGKPLEDVQMVAGRLHEINGDVSPCDDAQESAFNDDIISFCAMAEDLVSSELR